MACDAQFGTAECLGCKEIHFKDLPDKATITSTVEIIQRGWRIANLAVLLFHSYSK
jgi:hypothetical protein